MQIKVASLPGAVREVEVPNDNPTLQQALIAFGANPETVRDVRVNNVPVSNPAEYILEANAIVTIVGQVRGG